VKPSERIDQIAHERYSAETQGIVGHGMGTVAVVLDWPAAFKDYLDEQHELERRRRCFVRALLTMLGAAPDGAFTDSRYVFANELLDKAGIKARLPGMRAVMAEAEAEGLL
jgi:hypothetical protein